MIQYRANDYDHNVPIRYEIYASSTQYHLFVSEHVLLRQCIDILSKE